MGQITQPVWIFGKGRGDDAVLGTACAPADQGWSAYDAAAPAGTRTFTMDTAGHLDFVDGCVDGSLGFTCLSCTAGAAPASARDAAAGLLVAFLGSTLRGDTAYTAILDSGTLPSGVVRAP